MATGKHLKMTMKIQASVDKDKNGEDKNATLRASVSIQWNEWMGFFSLSEVYFVFTNFCPRVPLYLQDNANVNYDILNEKQLRDLVFIQRRSILELQHDLAESRAKIRQLESILIMNLIEKNRKAQQDSDYLSHSL